MPQNRLPYLIIAQSGRALAVSAARAGLTTHVIDRFDDLDTHSSALSTRVVAGTDIGLDTGHLLEHLADFSKISLAGIVIGSGLEAYSDVLKLIDRRWRLFSNTADVVKTCKNPQRFFSMLDDLHIQHPQTNVMAKMTSGDWLLKHSGGAGGGHMRKYTNTGDIPTHYYIQEKLEGQSLSVVFLANIRDARIVGVNETWTCSPQAYDYRYSGAVSLPEIETALYVSLEKIIHLLTQELHLVGLCGMDVIVDSNGQFYVLEINPRPTATFELHENDNSLFYAHIMACQGELIRSSEQYQGSRGHEVIYANSDLHVPQLRWPEWVIDRPHPLARIATGEPICTIRATANSPSGVRNKLEQHKSSLYKQLGLQRVAA